MKNSVPYRLLFVTLLMCTLTVTASALDFRQQLRSVREIKYKHWHLQKNRTTGYTKIETKTMLKKGEKYFLETSLNQDRQGKVFSEKKVWYGFEAGQLESYTEVDYRTGISISNRIKAPKILTTVKEGDEQLEISLDMEKRLVPFEALTLFLQQSIPGLRKKQKMTFKLYLPAVAIELKRKGLPLSFSKFEMAASVVGMPQIETPLGLQPAIRILIKPTSFLINAILPKEKTKFHFTFMIEPPFLLLEFEENKTRSILISYQP
jgi:hypothetical protein